jgi:hypothetical protein
VVLDIAIDVASPGEPSACHVNGVAVVLFVGHGWHSWVRDKSRWWVRVMRWRRWRRLAAVMKAGGGGERDEKSSECQTNNRIPVPFRFANLRTIPVSIPD